MKKKAGANENNRLPIKLILPQQGNERRNTTGGGKDKPFRTVDIEYRQSLSIQVLAIKEAYRVNFKKSVIAPMRVKLISKATAKSHRPQKLFSHQTCPIIGAGGLGELFLKASSNGLDELNRLIQENESAKVKKELSCIESIEAVTPNYRRKGLAPRDVLRRSPKRKQGYITRVRLFNFDNENDQEQIVSDFENICKKRNIHISSKGYSHTSYTFSAICKSEEDIDALSKIVAVRSVENMPIIRTVRPMVFNKKPLPKLLCRNEVEGDVPTVVVVDSGTTSNNNDLNSWIVGRESYVAPAYRNTDHGTFVSGLICWGNVLNPSISAIEENPCEVFDLQVLPNYDPSKGPTEFLQEQEFLISLDSALQKYANKYKVWNLSIGTNKVCSLNEFSEFAEELDNLQEKYEVSFVISAGNYSVPPLLSYPREASQLERGRITAPADSILGITVGSISHLDYKKNGPGEHCPSAFSRHGAGPNHIIKPDLIHYGGTCSQDGSHVSGIQSIYENGTAENLGTSFAAPLVSRTLAQIYHQITPTPKPVLARALLTHHARDPRSRQRVPDGEENFFGFGLPSFSQEALQCTSYSSTLIFDDVLRPGYYLEWDDFPYPESLYSEGRYYGEVWMTIAFSPSRGGRWGSEYCESHIEANFGVYYDKKNRVTGEIKETFQGLVPPEHKNTGILYESFQVANLRKWAPVRTYYGNMGESGERGKRWRLKVRLLTRHEKEDTVLRPQPFSLIVTIIDPLKKAPVYDEMARLLRSRFQSQNLTVRSAVKIREQV